MISPSTRYQIIHYDGAGWKCSVDYARTVHDALQRVARLQNTLRLHIVRRCTIYDRKNQTYVTHIRLERKQ